MSCHAAHGIQGTKIWHQKFSMWTYLSANTTSAIALIWPVVTSKTHLMTHGWKGCELLFYMKWLSATIFILVEQQQLDIHKDRKTTGISPTAEPVAFTVIQMHCTSVPLYLMKRPHGNRTWKSKHLTTQYNELNLSTETTCVFAMLSNFHLLNVFTQASTIARTILSNNANFLRSLCHFYVTTTNRLTLTTFVSMDYVMVVFGPLCRLN